MRFPIAVKAIHPVTASTEDIMVMYHEIEEVAASLQTQLQILPDLDEAIRLSSYRAAFRNDVALESIIGNVSMESISDSFKEGLKAAGEFLKMLFEKVGKLMRIIGVKLNFLDAHDELAKNAKASATDYAQFEKYWKDTISLYAFVNAKVLSLSADTAFGSDKGMKLIQDCLSEFKNRGWEINGFYVTQAPGLTYAKSPRTLHDLGWSVLKYNEATEKIREQSDKLFASGEAVDKKIESLTSAAGLAETTANAEQHLSKAGALKSVRSMYMALLPFLARLSQELIPIKTAFYKAGARTDKDEKGMPDEFKRNHIAAPGHI